MGSLAKLLGALNPSRFRRSVEANARPQEASLLSSEYRKSIYPIYDVPYLDLKIDGMYLDTLLELNCPGHQIAGLVPTTSGWLDYAKDEEVVWERILPSEGNIAICPILICPDDQDYFCTTLVVEIESVASTIYWNRFGINKKYEFGKYELLGAEVTWLKNVGPFKFSTTNYGSVIEELRTARKGTSAEI